MNRDEIIQRLRRMPINTRVRVPHCGSGNTLVLCRELDRAWWKCFRCEERGSIQIAPTLQELQAAKAAVQAVQHNTPLNPSDFVSELPAHATAFLVGRGLWPDIYRSWVVWHAPSNRLAMRMVFNGQPEGWLLRDTSTPRPKPKYIQRTEYPYVTPTFVGGAQIRASGGCELVLTEDALSACKTSLIPGTVSMALIGTHAQDAILKRILEVNPVRVSVWLDPDKAGRSATPQLLRSLALMGMPVRDVKYGNKDPKHYTVQEIQQVLATYNA